MFLGSFNSHLWKIVGNPVQNASSGSDPYGMLEKKNRDLIEFWRSPAERTQSRNGRVFRRVPSGIKTMCLECATGEEKAEAQPWRDHKFNLIFPEKHSHPTISSAPSHRIGEERSTLCVDFVWCMWWPPPPAAAVDFFFCFREPGTSLDSLISSNGC